MGAELSWTQEQINIGLAKRLWSYFYIHSSLRERDYAAAYQPYFDLLADDVVCVHEGPQDPRCPTWPGVIRGKQALIDTLLEERSEEIAGVDKIDLEDPVEMPMEFVGSGDRVVMLNVERFHIIKTDVTVRNNHNAVIMDFRAGLVTHMRIIATLSDYIEAHLGVGWSLK